MITVARLPFSIRSIVAELLGEDDGDDVPALPDTLPDAVKPVAGEGLRQLLHYQGPGYARLYLDRLRRFIGKRNVDEALLCEIARLMAARMSYDDPIRLAQLKLDEAAAAIAGDDIRKLRLDELVAALPCIVAEPLLDGLEWAGWLHLPVSIRFSAASWWGVRRLRIEASLRRWRLYSVRYPRERAWVERWLHMIDRSLTRQPEAAFAIAQTATMVQGYGDSYRHGLADWHLIIDGLVKPTFDGVLACPDLAGAVTEARAAATPDRRQAALKRKIAEIRGRLMVEAPPSAAT